jgi:xanthine dehydrogenase YagS FAD-binding subunit
MKSFAWVTPEDVPSAAAALLEGGAPLAGGIDILSSMKQGIATPGRVVNLKSLQDPGLRAIEGDKNLRVGALVTLSQLAADPLARARYVLLVEAALAVGSPQIRNVGTVGGNLCQRPRCWYFRDEGVACLKKGGADCLAYGGRNEYHAVLAGGPCWIVHPSDLAPALVALDARVLIRGGEDPNAERDIAAADFFVPPAVDVTRETVLGAGELVVAVELPLATAGWDGAYVKLRERGGFDWALASAAVALKLEGGVVQDARVALGGVAPVPLRSPAAEAALKGRPVTDETAREAGLRAFADADPLDENGFKLHLGPNAVRIAALKAAGVPSGAGAEDE